MHAFTNNLIKETSPYLLQHAYNPVNWFSWGAEALKKAKEEDKPILISIGYSACHWCHVMEKESFEDEATARLMNENFINIKIDREERPDLDHIYMDAVQAISGSGGWPLNVFLTPDCKPFYGGTYFPLERAFNRSSWKEVLTGVLQLFKERRNEVEAQAEELTNHINTNSSLQTKRILPEINIESLFDKQQAHTVFENIMKQADTVWGGFGKAPKFPQTFCIKYLFRYYNYTKNDLALKQACLSLDKMIYGGIYDQIGGGFARYSTDEEWLAPHFEKMLYDNALIISALCDAWQLTANKLYKDIVEQTIDFIERELMDANGGFYSALDADSENEEGKYYVWSYEEIKEILGDDATLFCEYYDVTERGNWEHKNILRILMPLKEFALLKKIHEAELTALLKRSASKLLLQRSKRTRPLLDDKILLGWNALMNIALSEASATFNNPKYKKLAVDNFDFLWSKFRDEHKGVQLYHTFKNDIAKYPAFLDDYAYLIKACINLQEITSDQKYINYAISLTDYVIQNFGAEDNQHFFYTGKMQNDVIIRKKEIYDGATPSANCVMAFNLHYLSIVFNNNEWKHKSLNFLYSIVEMIIKYPTSFGNWACFFIDICVGFNEIAITGKRYEKLRDEFLIKFIPNRVLVCDEAYAGEDNFILRGKEFSLEPFIYLCRNYTCYPPFKSVDDTVNSIEKSFEFI